MLTKFKIAQLSAKIQIQIISANQRNKKTKKKKNIFLTNKIFSKVQHFGVLNSIWTNIIKYNILLSSLLNQTFKLVFDKTEFALFVLILKNLLERMQKHIRLTCNVVFFLSLSSFFLAFFLFLPFFIFYIIEMHKLHLNSQKSGAQTLCTLFKKSKDLHRRPHLKPIINLNPSLSLSLSPKGQLWQHINRYSFPGIK